MRLTRRIDWGTRDILLTCDGEIWVQEKPLYESGIVEA